VDDLDDDYDSVDVDDVDVVNNDDNDNENNENRFLDSKGVALLSTTVPNSIKAFLNDDSSNSNNNNIREMPLHDIKLRTPSLIAPSQDIKRSLNQDSAQHHQHYKHKFSQQDAEKFDFVTGQNGYKTTFPWVDHGE
jgi:hypothetical protein